MKNGNREVIREEEWGRGKDERDVGCVEILNWM
jgi:hypothetical protein